MSYQESGTPPTRNSVSVSLNNHFTPLDHYQHACETGAIKNDPLQFPALNALQRTYQALLSTHSFGKRILAYWYAPKTITGVYLWGGVGIGKTYLMDCFYQSLPFQAKLRIHFHAFMQFIHSELKKNQGIADPLSVVAHNLAKQTRVICFDEFYVADITDAMLLKRLFQALFAKGICFIATSNVAPDDLYKNGLQRSQFIPAITLIKNHVDVIHIPSTIDYRLHYLQKAGVFFTPLNIITQTRMADMFAHLTFGQTVHDEPILVNNRYIAICKQADGTIWFNFESLCAVPRSTQDYLAIARNYSTVFLSDIPIIPSTATDTICLFISLIDILYDARTRVIFSAAKPVEDIYRDGYKSLEYARTHSRLLEMQSEDYYINASKTDSS